MDREHDEQREFPQASFVATGFSDDPEIREKEIAEMIEKSKEIYLREFGHLPDETTNRNS